MFLTLFIVSSLVFANNLILNGDFSRNPCNPNQSCFSDNSNSISPWKVISIHRTYEINSKSAFGLDFNSTDLNSDSAPICKQQLLTIRDRASHLHSTRTEIQSPVFNN